MGPCGFFIHWEVLGTWGIIILFKRLGLSQSRAVTVGRRVRPAWPCPSWLASGGLSVPLCPICPMFPQMIREAGAGSEHGTRCTCVTQPQPPTKYSV